MACMSVPVIDLSPLLGNDNNSSRIQVLEQVKRACEEWGFFQVLNHGIDPQLVGQLRRCSQSFFTQPLDEKVKLVNPHSPLGFLNRSGTSKLMDRKEHLLFFSNDHPASHLNSWPEDDQSLRSVVERTMHEGARVSKLVTSIVLESLGLSHDRFRDLYSETADMVILPFYPASPCDLEQEMVLGQHRDAGILTLLFQLNGVAGLQILKDGEWITVDPVENSVVVNIADVMQVWSNGRVKSVMHRVVKQELDRYSCAYFHIPGVETRIEPLKEFTLEEPPKYRGFNQGEYIQLRMKNRISNKDEEVSIEHYAIG